VLVLTLAFGEKGLLPKACGNCVLVLTLAFGEKGLLPKACGNCVLVLTLAFGEKGLLPKAWDSRQPSEGFFCPPKAIVSKYTNK
jgi:hypothetical protein